MTEQEKSELNRRVAVAMEWEVGETFIVGGWRWWCEKEPKSRTYPTKESAESHAPDFTTDPAAANTLKAHMKEQGWHYQLGWGTDGGRAYVDTRHTIGESYGQESEEIAMVLAFLAAVDAEKEQKP